MSVSNRQVQTVYHQFQNNLSCYSALTSTEVFPGGVFWVSVSNIDKSKLLTKLQNLCARLDRESRPPPLNLEEAKDRLRLVLVEQHPR